MNTGSLGKKRRTAVKSSEKAARAAGVNRGKSPKTGRLWGVNYHLPFNHNFVNLEELRADPFRCLDADIESFRRMGVQIVRMHVYDREISDREGHIVNNLQMKIFDAVIEKLDQAGIAVMMTPLTWWNTVVNQIAQERDYAFWHIGSGDAFGFANYYGKDAMIWDPGALKAQKIYLREFFSRRNTFSGKRLSDYKNLVAVEIFNEPAYLKPGLLQGEDLHVSMGWRVFSRAEDRAALLADFAQYRKKHPKLTTFDDQFNGFNAWVVERYVRTMFGVIDGEMKRPYLKTHIGYQRNNPDIRAMFEKLGIDAVNCEFYMNGPHGFDSAGTEDVNYFEVTRKKIAETLKFDDPDHQPVRVVYEYDAPSSQKNYHFGTAACAFSGLNVVIAAHFNYTPELVAAWNPGWLIHYMNFSHTPAKAAAFAAGNKIFHSIGKNYPIPDDNEVWKGKGFLIDGKRDLVVAYDGRELIHSGSFTEEDIAPGKTFPDRIFGIGASPFACCEGNGIYILEKQAGKWILEIFPNQVYVNAPLRARACREMANRYVNVNKEPPVSRLTQEKRLFSCPGRKIARIRDSRGNAVAGKVGKFLLDPGKYEVEFK